MSRLVIYSYLQFVEDSLAELWQVCGTSRCYQVPIHNHWTVFKYSSAKKKVANEVKRPVIRRSWDAIFSIIKNIKSKNNSIMQKDGNGYFKQSSHK